MTHLILKLIKQHDKHNPITSKKIEDTLHIPGSDVRDRIRHLRRTGHAIISGDMGYYYTDDPHDVQNCIQNLKSRSMSMLTTIKEMEFIKSRLDKGQGSLL